MIEAYLDLLEESYYELKFAFDGLKDEHVWKRPSPELLSVGELAGHIAYWEAVKLAGEGGVPLPSPDKCKVVSPLIDQRFSYYTSNREIYPSELHLAMKADEVYAELLRIHTKAVSYFKELNVDLQAHPAGWPESTTYNFLSQV